MEELKIMAKKRSVGQSYRATIMPIKIKNGIPTVISVGGNLYILQAKDGFTGKKTKKEDGANEQTNPQQNLETC
jgi:hypothetical protein